MLSVRRPVEMEYRYIICQISLNILDFPIINIHYLNYLSFTVIKSDPERELFVISIDLMQRSVAIKLEGFQISKI